MRRTTNSGSVFFDVMRDMSRERSDGLSRSTMTAATPQVQWCCTAQHLAAQLGMRVVCNHYDALRMRDGGEEPEAISEFDCG